MRKYKVVEVEESLYFEGGVFKIVEVNNPHVSQHTGFFSTREKAEDALKHICWGEVVHGDC